MTLSFRTCPAFTACLPTPWKRSWRAAIWSMTKPDAILNIVDATNIERNLYLTTQLAELGIPMVIALNMIDVVT